MLTGGPSECFSPLPGFKGSGGSRIIARRSSSRGFSPLPGFEGSGGFDARSGEHWEARVSVPFRGLRGLEVQARVEQGYYFVGFSPLPGFEGSGGRRVHGDWTSCASGFSPLPGFEGSGGEYFKDVR